MLHNTISPRTLGLARILVYGLCFHSVLNLRLCDLIRLRNFDPVGVLRVLPRAVWDHLLLPEAVVACSALTLTLLALLILGLGPYRLLACLTCVLFTVLQGLSLSFGNIGHSGIALLYVAWVMAVSPACDGLALRRSEPVRGNPAVYSAAITTAALLLCLTYTLIGARRLAHGGLTIFLDGTILREVALRDVERGSFSMGLGIGLLEYPLLKALLQIGFPIVTLCELLSPLCLFDRRFRRLWIAVMLPFHLSTGLLMGIWFPYNMLLIPFFLTDVDHLVARWWPGSESSAIAAPCTPLRYNAAEPLAAG